MADTPMTVQTRPFAIEPYSSVMTPDGIFDNAIYKQRIACHYTNTSAVDLTNVTMYLESVGDPGIVPVSHTYFFPKIPAGASVLVFWEADFRLAVPGKPLVSFIAQAAGYSSFRTIQRIFVSETRYDDAAKKWIITVPEGRLEISDLKFILPGDNGWWPVPEPPTHHGPWRLAIPTAAQMTWIPNPAYPGKHGELPFADPWWKALAMFVIWAIGAFIIIITHDGESDGSVVVGAQGEFDETDPSVDCCTPVVAGNASGELGAKLGAWSGGIGIASVIVGALGDDADPWWRGQLATTPVAGELTVAEHVDAQWQILEPLEAGKPGRYEVRWDYLRETTGNSYPFSVSETRAGVHIADPIVIQAPPLVHTGEPLWATAQLTKADQSLFRGPDLYPVALFEAPQGHCIVVPMGDDGLAFDERANDGTYTGGIDFRKARRAVEAAGQSVYGLWRVYVFGQDVNRAPAGLPPEIAAQTIGGVPVVSPMQITFGSDGPCPLAAHVTINVVP